MRQRHHTGAPLRAHCSCSRNTLWGRFTLVISHSVQVLVFGLWWMRLCHRWWKTSISRASAKCLNIRSTVRNPELPTSGLHATWWGQRSLRNRMFKHFAEARLIEVFHQRWHKRIHHSPNTRTCTEWLMTRVNRHHSVFLEHEQWARKVASVS